MRGIAGLHNELKPGRPRSTGEDEIAKLIAHEIRIISFRQATRREAQIFFDAVKD